ncbi:RL30 protein, partial [Crocuta crocuta]
MVAAKEMEKWLESISSRLQLVTESGKMVRPGDAELVILTNCPALRKSETEYGAMLAQTTAATISSWARHGGNARVCTLAVPYLHDSDVTRSIREETGEKS